MRSFLLLLFLATTASVSSVAWAQQVLVTPSYKVTITEHCPEGVVGCDDVSYLGISIKTGSSITLKGTSVMVLCADGITPCHLSYYEFKHGEFRYLVYPSGQLTVEKGSKVLLSESGTWQ